MASVSSTEQANRTGAGWLPNDRVSTQHENSLITAVGLYAMFRKNAYAETIVSLAGEGYETD
nr:hypothetical protein [Yersinia intermedia]MDA5514528.1 hypothetical protein [Yersinia intermedia]